MLNSLILFAQAAEEKAKDAAPAEGIGAFFQNPMMPILVVMVLFFFLIILPAQRPQRKEQENLLAALKKNDEVITTSGIIGTVAKIKEGANEVTLKIDDNVRIRILRTSIAQIVKKDEPPKDPASAPPATPANTNIKPNA